MREIYRKHGRSVRYEHGHVISSVESGEAVEDGTFFSATPLRNRRDERDAMPSANVESTAREIQSLVAHPLSIERLVVSEGTADHEFGDRRWSDSSRRIHLSLVKGSYRALIDLGAFDLEEVAAVATAFARSSGERDCPDRLRLSPRVAAAFLPTLFGASPPNVMLVQSAGGTDGKGNPIEDARADSSPNWYRPSYRVRPMRVAMNLRALCSVTDIEPGLPEAVALLAPVDGMTMSVLCAAGDHVFATTVRVSRIESIALDARWYPYGTGSFGTMMTVV